MQFLETKAVFVQRAGLEILHQNVAIGQQLLGQRLPFRIGKVHVMDRLLRFAPAK